MKRFGIMAFAVLLAVICLLLAGCGESNTTIQPVIPAQEEYIAPAQPDLPEPTVLPAEEPQEVPEDGIEGDMTGEEPGEADWEEETELTEETAFMPVVINRGDINIGLVVTSEASIHPLKCIYRDLISMNSLVFESLVDLDDSMQPVACLSDTWTANGTTYTFHLRQGVTFHNGASLTPQDVVETWKYIQDVGSASPWYDRTGVIKSMKVVDEANLEVTFNYGGYMALYAMTFPIVQRNTLNYAMPMGTGPYWYNAYSVGTALRIESNPFWWKKEAKVRSVVGWCYKDTTGVLSALLTGEIDTLTTRSSQASLYKKLSDYMTKDYTTTSYEMLIPNLTSGTMTDIRIRKAVMYAIDRTMIASNVYGSMVQESEVPVVPGSYLYETQAAQYNYSPEKALQMLLDAGLNDSNGDGMFDTEVEGLLEYYTVRLVTYNEPGSETRSNAAQLIASQLAKVGIKVEITVTTKGKMANVFKRGNFDLALINMNLSGNNDLYSYLRHDGKRNYSGYASQEMNTLLQSARSADTAEELQDVYSQIQLKIVEELPIMGLYFHTGSVISTENIRALHGIYELNVLNGMESVILD